MELDEVRKFKIDKNKKKECKLQPSKQGIIEIEIKKEKELEGPSKFIYKLVGSDYLPKEAFLKCDYGYVEFLKTKGKAEKCGIGRIFTELCMNEKNLHQTSHSGTNKNLGIQKLNDYIKDSKDKPKFAKERKQLKAFKKWSKSHCSEIIYLEMTANPPSNAHVYFNSAKASGFTDMFMITGLIDFQKYPDEGPCPTKILQDRYDDGFMVEGNEKTRVVGWNWFFCKPKNPEEQNKCTIL